MPDYTYRHLVIVHGIGKHAPNETALTFMNEFTRHLPSSGRFRVEVDNLIQTIDPILHSEKVAPGVKPAEFRPSCVRLHEYADEKVADDPKGKLKAVHVIGFSEVFWTPITAGFRATNNGPPIPIFTWARSVGTRVLGHDRHEKLWTDAIDNIESLLGLLARAALLYKKSGELVDVLNIFLGDVQMYAESDQLRHEINGVFLSVLSRVPAFAQITSDQFRADTRYPDFHGFDHPQIYVIAHSEGTVVSLNSLVEAAIMAHAPSIYAAGQREEIFAREDKLIYATPTASRASVWLPLVAGFATLGSPIDKHYTIWKTRFRTDRIDGFPLGGKRIPWFNFWDQSDPVGYGLTSIFDRHRPCGQPPSDAERLFDIQFDRGFMRYPLPGKAHVDYWTDKAIHLKIMHDLMHLPHEKGRQKFPVRTKLWGFLMPWGDYLAYIVVRLLTAGIIFAFLYLLLGGANVLTAPAQRIVDVMHAWATPFMDWVSNILRISMGWIFLTAVLVEVVGRIFKPKPERSNQPIWKNLEWSDVMATLRLATVVWWVAYVLLMVRNSLPGEPQATFDEAAWLIVLILGEKVVLVICAWRGTAAFATLSRLLIAVLSVLWLTAAAALAVTLNSGQAVEIKNILGYAVGLLGGILLWQIHTRIHKGLVQMWRYSVDQDARVPPK